MAYSSARWSGTATRWSSQALTYARRRQKQCGLLRQIPVFLFLEGPESAPSITMDYIEGESLDKVWNELPEEEFNSFLLSDILKAAPRILRDIASRSLRTDHKIVFTHGDFDPRNIMVKDGQVTALLDWEDSGWYPEYWEFIKTFNASDHRVSWYNYVEQIFPKCYEAEYINDRFLGSILRH